MKSVRKQNAEKWRRWKFDSSPQISLRHTIDITAGETCLRNEVLFTYRSHAIPPYVAFAMSAISRTSKFVLCVSMTIYIGNILLLIWFGIIVGILALVHSVERDFGMLIKSLRPQYDRTVFMRFGSTITSVLKSKATRRAVHSSRFNVILIELMVPTNNVI
jgi:hypothetical protein